MAAANRGGRTVSALLRDQPRTYDFCAWKAPLALFSNRSRRLYSSAAAEAAVQPPEPSLPLRQSDTSQSLYPNIESDPYKIKSGIILTRAPIITRQQTPFESAFFLYQKRLEERLSASFYRKIYFRKDTPPELDWRLKKIDRHGMNARDIGNYKRHGPTHFDDEVLIGSNLRNHWRNVDKLLDDAVMRVSEDGQTIPVEERAPKAVLSPRLTEADKRGDVRRLDRKLDRTLYLVVKQRRWMFPAGVVPTHEALHETATRALEESVGVNMHTWMVGRVPVAHHVQEPVYSKDQQKLVEYGCKTFLMKGRILAGQADLTNNKQGVTDFKWLTREELEQELPQDYVSQLRGMMADR